MNGASQIGSLYVVSLGLDLTDSAKVEDEVEAELGNYNICSHPKTDKQTIF